MTDSGYIFIAKKDAYNDYCMGCHMGYYGGDFAIESELSAVELTQLLAAYIDRNNIKDESDESGAQDYEFMVFKSGVPVWVTGLSYECSRGSLVYDSEGEHVESEEAGRATEAEVVECLNYANVIAKDRKEQRRLAKFTTVEAAREKLREDQEKREVAEYARLKAKFEQK